VPSHRCECLVVYRYLLPLLIQSILYRQHRPTNTAYRSYGAPLIRRGSHEQQSTWPRCMDMICPLATTIPLQERLHRALPTTGLAQNASTRALHEACARGVRCLDAPVSARPAISRHTVHFEFWPPDPPLIGLKKRLPWFLEPARVPSEPTKCISDINFSLAPTPLSDNSSCVSQAPCVSMTLQHCLFRVRKQVSPSNGSRF
jgi:hypothetical protein